MNTPASVTRLRTFAPAPGAAKLVFVNRYFAPDQSATSRLLSDLAFRLAERGLPVEIVTSRQLYENPTALLPSREIVRGVVVHRVAAATYGRARLSGRALDYASFHLAAGLKLLQILSPEDVVVAKTDPPLVSITASVAVRLRRATLINWLQDLFPEVAGALAPKAVPGWLRSPLTAARDRSLRAADMNVVLSEGMRRRLLLRGIDEGCVDVIPNWADTSEVSPKRAAQSRTRYRLGLEHCFVAGYSGNLGRAHEFATLLGAARLLRDDPEIVFLITGGGAKVATLQEASHSDGLTNLIFQDYQPAETLSDSLAAADVHFVSLLPALEGLIVPSKVYGILAAGRPVVFIGDPAGDVARLIGDCGCGVTIPVGDSARLARELRALRDDRDRVARMGQRARERAVNQHSSEHSLARWLDMLAAVAPQLIKQRASGVV